MSCHLSGTHGSKSAWKKHDLAREAIMTELRGLISDDQSPPPPDLDEFALARPISRAGVRPRPREGSRLERPGPGTLPVDTRSRRDRERKGEKKRQETKKKVASKEARSQEKALDGRTSGKRRMIIDCRRLTPIDRAPPSPMLPSNSRHSAAGQQPTAHPGICWFIFPSLPAFRVSAFRESLASWLALLPSQTAVSTLDSRPSTS